MKTLAALILSFAFALPAYAVDVTITLSAQQANRFADACGKVKQLVDAQQPPQPRACTNAEAKAWIIELMRRVVVDVEGAAAVKQAVDAIVLTPFDPS